MRKRTFQLFLIFFWVAATAGLILSGCKNSSTESQKETQADTLDTLPPRTYMLDICIDTLDVEENILRSGENLSTVLGERGVPAQTIDKISTKSQSIFDMRKLRAGQQYMVLRDTALTKIHYFVYQDNPTHYIIFDLRDSVQVYPFHKEITHRSKSATGTITSSLWNCIRENGEDPLLSDHLSEIYAWQIDFFGIAKGDWFKVLYTQACVDDSVEIEISAIDGAIFSHMGNSYYAIPFTQDSVTSYFDVTGQNLRKAFLKAPLKFSRISSRFSSARRHPILKIVRPHYGVDYAAPSGTPVMSIGDGTVIKKGYSGGGGNSVTIRHNSIYTTTYMHLSGYAKGLSAGKRVRQGELIGYVGSTGLSSGPHLDFRVFKGGSPVNPLTMDSPAADSIKPAMRDSFESVKRQVMLRLDNLNRATPVEGKADSSQMAGLPNL